jgi:hypothetical protein
VGLDKQLVLVWAKEEEVEGEEKKKGTFHGPERV